MAYDIFLKIDGIDGESMDDKHKNEIEVLSWRWNIHQESTMHAGSGLGSGNRQRGVAVQPPAGSTAAAAAGETDGVCAGGRHCPSG